MSFHHQLVFPPDNFLGEAIVYFDDLKKTPSSRQIIPLQGNFESGVDVVTGSITVEVGVASVLFLDMGVANVLFIDIVVVRVLFIVIVVASVLFIDICVDSVLFVAKAVASVLFIDI